MSAMVTRQSHPLKFRASCPHLFAHSMERLLLNATTPKARSAQYLAKGQCEPLRYLFLRQHRLGGPRAAARAHIGNKFADAGFAQHHGVGSGHGAITLVATCA